MSGGFEGWKYFSTKNGPTEIRVCIDGAWMCLPQETTEAMMQQAEVRANRDCVSTSYDRIMCQSIYTFLNAPDAITLLTPIFLANLNGVEE